MWFHARTMGVWGHAPQIVFIKNGAIWCILGIPKHVIINLKTNNVKDNKLTIKNFDHIFLQYKKTRFSHLSMKMEITTFAFYKWGLGRQQPSPPTQKANNLFFFKIKQIAGVSFKERFMNLFFYFLQASLNP